MTAPLHCAASLLPYAVSFAAMLAVDYVFAKYTLAVVARSEHRAGMMASLVTMFNAAVILSFVATPPAVVAAMVGAYVGTYLATRK